MKQNDLKWLKNYRTATDYYDESWPNFREPDNVKYHAEALGLDLADIYMPVRDEKYVSTELQESRTVVLSQTKLLQLLSCSLCNGTYRNVMIVKQCAHRFCSACINRWIRLGNKTCPNCQSKLTTRRMLRKERIASGIIDALFTPRVGENIGGAESGKRTSVEAYDALNSSDNSLDADYRDELESNYDADEVLRPTFSKCGQKRRKNGAQLYADEAFATRQENASDDAGYEVFLVCLNHNLPPAVCSMARELSKRPLKLPSNTTVYGAAVYLARKLIRDVLGDGDLQYIIQNLMFVRDGELYMASSGAPLCEVSRNITEGKGPNVIRYLLSESLFSLCERADIVC